jgi:serine/threonine protein kinase
VVLFEMLTGRRLFEGETASETMAAVMKDEIRWDLPAAHAAGGPQLLERCLTRDPRARLQSIGESARSSRASRRHARGRAGGGCCRAIGSRIGSRSPRC